MGAAKAFVAMALAAALLGGCSSQPQPAADSGPARRTPSHAPGSTSPEAGASAANPQPRPRGSKPLRPGERFETVAMPRPYAPKAPTSGTDDYRCFLLDPHLSEDAFVTGFDVAPGQTAVVHHVILFRVTPQAVAAARAQDRAQPGQGWTCFGGSGLDGAGASIDNAPWLGAWAPGGGEQVMAPDVGIPLAAGSQIVMQVHYNLLAGHGSDLSSARLRLAPGTEPLSALQTMLLPAPVELPCRQGVRQPLCDREAALEDVKARFGSMTGQIANFLNLACQGNGPSPTQSCTRTVHERATIRAVAGHMHLLGREIRIDVNPGRRDHRTVLDIPVWDFDNQGSRPVPKPVRLDPGDEVRVTCRHDQALRDVLPAFRGQPERYVLWGEGTTDEMCLGILLVTRP